MAVGYCEIASGFLDGLEVIPVSLEVCVEKGVIPSFNIFGLVDVETLEARERVRCAIKSSGFSWPEGKVIVNITPNSVKKTGGAVFDLAIACGILAATGQADPKAFDGAMLCGELHLGGHMEPGLRGFPLFALKAGELGLKLFAPCASERYRCVDWDRCSCFESLSDVCSMKPSDMADEIDAPIPEQACDRADRIEGHPALRCAMADAALNSGSLLVWADRNGAAARIASELPSIMPAPSPQEAALIEGIASAARIAPPEGRPFRSPHCSATLAGMFGGGRPIMPGEVSLAHGGVLFLQDVQEFKPSMLQQLRHARLDGEVAIVRTDGI